MDQTPEKSILRPKSLFQDEECPPPRTPTRDNRVSFFIPSHKQSGPEIERLRRSRDQKKRRTSIFFQSMARPISTFTYSPSKKEQNVSKVAMYKDRAYLLTNACFDTRIFIICIICSFITAFILHLDTENKWKPILNEGKNAVNIIGAFLSFALVFRTNICCEYYWNKSETGRMIFLCSM